MVYWMIMALLGAVALGLIIAIIMGISKNGRQKDDIDEYAEDDTEEEDYPQPVRRKSRHREEREPEPAVQEPPRKKVKKQWKVILENLETWEKFSYIFYDNIGIGRSKNEGQFEKFLTVRDDPRVSKIHCAIIRKGDKLYLKDMGSRNGTYLNGKRIQQPVIIQRDDIIGAGESKIEVKKVLRERD